MQAFTTVTSRTVAIPKPNIDTDQIIPARFLKVTNKTGLGTHAFADWRYDADGGPRPDFVLNTDAATDAEVLVAGHNFGCGSSREHAPWALADFGFRAVISTEIADIFRNNALKNGLLPIIVDGEFHQQLLDCPGETVTIDLEARRVTRSDGAATTFEVEPFSRYCLLNGLDQLDYLLSHAEAVSQYEEHHQ